MNTKEYKGVFPDVTLRTDNQAAGRWETNGRGPNSGVLEF